MSLIDALRPRKTKSETARILDLPVREPPNLEDYQGPDLTPELALPGSGGKLRPVQSWALSEIRTERGAVLAVGVGHGKTLIAYGTPVVLGVDPEDVLVLVPASLRETFRREGRKYADLFRTPHSLPVLSYAELSRPSGRDYLERQRPKVIVCDEAHYLRSNRAARTRRFLRYLKDADDTVLVAMSGTLFTSSIRDGQDLIVQALGDGAPVPAAYSTMEWWSACVDVPRGLESNPSTYDYRRISKLVERYGCGRPVLDLPWSERKAAVREAFHRRFVLTPGVVHTKESSASNALYFQPIRVDGLAYAEVVPYLNEVQASWTRPDGELLDDELRVNQTLRMLALGFFYTWEWGPDGEDTEWNEARLEYGRQVRNFLKRDRVGLDSPYLVEQAIRRGLLIDAGVPIVCESMEGRMVRARDYPDLVRSFQDWDPIRHRAAPVPTPVYLTDKIVDRVIRFARDTVKGRKSRGIIWYAHDATADLLEVLGVPVFRPGEDPEAEPGPPGHVVAMSIASHGIGKNLQSWSDNFVLYPPANGKTWEQLVGRTHRPGQDADEVWVYPVVTSPEHARALRNAREQARFAETVQGQKQKMNQGTWLRAKTI